MSDFDKGKDGSAFNCEEDMWAYIENQEDMLNQLDDILARVKKNPKVHGGIAERPISFGEALRLATEGDPISQFNLSIAYTKGDGVPQDSEKAAHWLLHSAENGYAPAQYNIGCNWQNSGDRQKAIKWFLRAANQNFGPAQFNLGVLCGTAGDYVRAYVWFHLAAQNRVEQAKENRDKAAAFLSEDDLREARFAVCAMMMDSAEQG